MGGEGMHAQWKAQFMMIKPSVHSMYICAEVATITCKINKASWCAYWNRQDCT